MPNKFEGKIAQIGLGVMGQGIARNLIASGFDLRLCDISDKARRSFEGMGCSLHESPIEAARDADIVITILPDWSHVQEALLGENGAAQSLRKDALIIDMSTIGASQSDLIGDVVIKSGFRFMDAPLGRTPRDAEGGTLLVIAGGDDADVAEARPIFDSIGNQLVHVGPRGTGIRLKLINNYMSTVGTVLVAEALTLANKVGLDRDKTVEVLSSTTAGRGQLIVNYPKKVLAGDISADFPLRMAQKDVSHALNLGAENGVPMLLGAVSREAFSLAKPWQRENDDWTAMLLLLEDIARVEHQPTAKIENRGR